MKRLLGIWLPNWPIQRLRSHLQESIDAAPDSAPKSHHAPSAEDRERAQVRDPRTNEWPCTVLWQNDPRRGRVVAARCRSAAAKGVRFGMPVVEASELLATARQSNRDHVRAGRVDSQSGHEPNSLVAFHDPRLDREMLDTVAKRVQSEITPLVAIEPIEKKCWAGKPLNQPDLLLCDITGAAHLFDGEAGLLRATRRLLDAMGLFAWLAVADTVGAAWAVVRYQHKLPSRSIRSIDSRSWPGEPRQRNTIVPIGESEEWLDPLPVDSLRIDVETATTLRRLGVETVGSLRRLPRDGLAMRLGQQLVQRFAQLVGEIDEPLMYQHATAEHRHQLDLEYATDDPAILKDRIELLIGRACEQLSQRQRGALQIECRLEFEAHSPCVIRLGLFAPSSEADHWRRLLLAAFESRRLRAEVVRLCLTIPLTGPLRHTQNWIFPDAENTNDTWDGSRETAVARLVDSLSGRLGREEVRGVRLTENPLPEEAYCSYPLTGRPSLHRPKAKARALRPQDDSLPTVAQSPRDSSAPSPRDALRRPLVLLEQPAPLAVIEAGASQSDPPGNGGHATSKKRPLPSVESASCPGRVRLGGKAYRIVASWGPERIETGWWQGASIRRDYFRVQTDRGEAWWIYRDLTSSQPQWMLHGRFT